MPFGVGKGIGFGRKSVLGGAAVTLLGASHGLGADQAATTTLKTNFDTWLGKTSAFVQVPFDQSSWAAYQSSIAYLLGLYPAATNAVWSVPLFAAGGTFADTIGGSKDATVFTPLAQGILAKAPASGEIVIRIGWEFNLSSQPWYASGNVTNYINAFRHIVDVFRAVSSRFVFDWCPNLATIAQAGFDVETAYPGDAYVDIIGMDYYWNSAFDNMIDGTFGVSGFNYNRTIDRGLDWQVAFAVAHGKKLAMDEWAANNNYAKDWVTAMATFMTSNNYRHQAWWNSSAAFNGTISGNQYTDLTTAYRAKFG